MSDSIFDATSNNCVCYWLDSSDIDHYHIHMIEALACFAILIMIIIYLQCRKVSMQRLDPAMIATDTIIEEPGDNNNNSSKVPQNMANAIRNAKKSLSHKISTINVFNNNDNNPSNKNESKQEAKDTSDDDYDEDDDDEKGGGHEMSHENNDKIEKNCPNLTGQGSQHPHLTEPLLSQDNQYPSYNTSDNTDNEQKTSSNSNVNVKEKKVNNVSNLKNLNNLNNPSNPPDINLNIESDEEKDDENGLKKDLRDGDINDTNSNTVANDDRSASVKEEDIDTNGKKNDNNIGDNDDSNNNKVTADGNKMTINVINTSLHSQGATQTQTQAQTQTRRHDRHQSGFGTQDSGNLGLSGGSGRNSKVLLRGSGSDNEYSGRQHLDSDFITNLEIPVPLPISHNQEKKNKKCSKSTTSTDKNKNKNKDKNGSGRDGNRTGQSSNGGNDNSNNNDNNINNGNGNSKASKILNSLRISKRQLSISRSNFKRQLNKKSTMNVNNAILLPVFMYFIYFFLALVIFKFILASLALNNYKSSFGLTNDRHYKAALLILNVMIPFLDSLLWYSLAFLLIQKSSSRRAYMRAFVWGLVVAFVLSTIYAIAYAEGSVRAWNVSSIMMLLYYGIRSSICIGILTYMSLKRRIRNRFRRWRALRFLILFLFSINSAYFVAVVLMSIKKNDIHKSNANPNPNDISGLVGSGNGKHSSRESADATNLLNICWYNICEILRNLIQPFVLYATLLIDTEYWRTIAKLLTMSSTFEAPKRGGTLDLSIENFDEIDDFFASSRVPVLDFAQFELKKTIGKGANATVYRAFYRGMPVAAKDLSFQLEELSYDIVHRFCREALLFARIRHINIIKFYGVCLRPPSLFLVFELATHGTLRNFLDSCQRKRQRARKEKEKQKQRERELLKSQKYSNRDKDKEKSRSKILSRNFNRSKYEESGNSYGGGYGSNYSTVASKSERDVSNNNDNSSNKCKEYFSLPWDKKIWLALDVATGMQVLHSRDIIHRDLNTNNVLVTLQYVHSQQRLVAKICDFGLARKLKPNHQARVNSSFLLAATTPSYAAAMPPSVATGIPTPTHSRTNTNTNTNTNGYTPTTQALTEHSYSSYNKTASLTHSMMSKTHDHSKSHSQSNGFYDHGSVGKVSPTMYLDEKATSTISTGTSGTDLTNLTNNSNGTNMSENTGLTHRSNYSHCSNRSGSSGSSSSSSNGGSGSDCNINNDKKSKSKSHSRSKTKSKTKGNKSHRSNVLQMKITEASLENGLSQSREDERSSNTDIININMNAKINQTGKPDTNSNATKNNDNADSNPGQIPNFLLMPGNNHDESPQSSDISTPLPALAALAAPMTPQMGYYQMSTPSMYTTTTPTRNQTLTSQATQANTQASTLNKTMMFEQDIRLTAECGTVRYMAPEVLENLKITRYFTYAEDSLVLYSKSVDVFSFGLILWELCTEKILYDEIESLVEIKNFVLKGNRPHVPNYVPADYGRLMKDCWTQSPIHRPKFNDIVNKLKKMLGIESRQTNTNSRVGSVKADSSLLSWEYVNVNEAKQRERERKKEREIDKVKKIKKRYKKNGKGSKQKNKNKSKSKGRGKGKGKRDKKKKTKNVEKSGQKNTEEEDQNILNSQK